MNNENIILTLNPEEPLSELEPLVPAEGGCKEAEDVILDFDENGALVQISHR